ncbi:hypothetical protein GSI_00514 [Ganoderma sinense ZZ0214-1]|uniref:Uncharacterized protein n=1 Tax=Ganoderma sinense ZZ0214-1 TaxID=1077348 RepID=A0A2G8SSU0_9APHY|nr:hypothetical protein GSI_00514 [Ganoderma sinense ZZ0214-1]
MTNLGPTPTQDWQEHAWADRTASLGQGVQEAYSWPSHHSETILPGCLGLFRLTHPPALIDAIYHFSGGLPLVPLPPVPPPRRPPMSALLLVPLVASLVSRIPGAAAQGTNAVCNSGYGWMSNSKGQSPCLISSWLFTPCSAPADSWVYPLSPGYHYNTPLDNSQSATPCRCNTVLFSTIAACATCQGQEEYIVPWSTYSQNCSTVYVQKYPATIPSGTSIPAWAYLDITTNNTFNPAAAQAVASQNAPDSTAPSTASQTAGATSLTAAPSATSGSNGAPSTGQNSGSTSKKSSNVGPIVGGVVGGIAAIVLIGVVVFFVLRSRRNAARNQPTGPVDLTANGNYGQYPQQQYANYPADMQYGEKSPVGAQSDPSQPLMVNQRLYDPNDPTTFPSQDPYAGSLQASTGYPTTETTAAASNPYVGYQGSVATNQNPTYHGAPEL